MSKHHGRQKKVQEEEHENHERWAVSYADMMTVLVGLFIVLYAMSQVDQVKYEALAGSLAAGFGNESPTVLTGADGIMDSAGSVPETDLPVAPETVAVAPDPAITTPDDPIAAEKALQKAAAKGEASRLLALQAEIEARLAAVGMADQVRYVIDERGLVIGMVANDFYFDPASAVLKPAAKAVLDAAGPVMAAISDQISVEGHANNLPVSGQYPTNWELSADRATQVLRHLVEVDGVPGNRIVSLGYGDARPLIDDSANAVDANRRVDLVIHSPLPEPVRALLPEVISGSGG